jgi:hypothetical protein
MFKIALSIVALLAIANGSDYERSNSAAKEALGGLDCEFEDCKKPEPKVIIQERVVEKPVIVEHVIIKEKIVEKPVERVVEKVVYKDRPAQEAVQVETIAAPTSTSKRIYDASFDIPVIGVEGSSFYYNMDKFYIADDKVKTRNISTNNNYLKSQTRPSWARMSLKNGNSLFLSKYDKTIAYHRDNFTQINFHVELPEGAISNDTTIVSLPTKSFKNTSGYVNEYSTCTFNDYLPNDDKLQSVVQLNGKNYLDVKCTVDLYNYNTQDTSVNTEIQNMVQSESFEFIPVYRVFPPVRKGSKSAVLGSSLKKFVFANEIEE